MNSFTQSENVKITTVRIPGSEIGKTIRRSARRREAAVDERGVLELARDRLEEPHQQPGRERDRERRVDEDQRPEPVLQPELGDHARERQEEQRRRHEVDEEDPDAEALAPAAGQARERVARRAARPRA